MPPTKWRGAPAKIEPVRSARSAAPSCRPVVLLMVLFGLDFGAAEYRHMRAARDNHLANDKDRAAFQAVLGQTPLAVRMRPVSLDEVAGHAVEGGLDRCELGSRVAAVRRGAPSCRVVAGERCAPDRRGGGRTPGCAVGLIGQA